MNAAKAIAICLFPAACLPFIVSGQTGGDSSGRQLQRVIVTGLSKVRAAREQPQAVTVIDTRAYYNRPQGAVDLVNQAAGVKVRQGGGLGSYADYYINGLSGRQVKFFLDGIPLNYLGAGLNLNILPVNIIDRIEIYKGVVPVRLGTDALGGAIDIITRRSARDYLDLSYATSSFHTHRISLNGKRSIGSRFYVEATGFYNYSKNDYTVDVTIPNVYGNPEQLRLPEFHNRFENYYSGLTLGMRPKKWADELALFSSLSGLAQQIPNNLDMTQPYGKVTNSLNSWNNGIKYSKTNIGGRFSIDLYLGINRLRNHYIDTSLNSYTWDGKIAARRLTGGETYAPVQDIITTHVNHLGRLTASYRIGDHTRLDGNFIGSSFTQEENDPKTALYPVRLCKLTAGLGLEQTFFDRRLTSITSLKFYSYSDRGYAISTTNQLSGAEARKQKTGWNEALKWRIDSALLLKASYEYAVRLPEEDELFGTYAQRTRPNPALVAETSHNGNLDLQYFRSRWRLELNGFYRMAANLIYAPPTPYFLIYQNLLGAQVCGVDAEFSHQLLPCLRLSLNATYQAIINKTSAANSGNASNNHYNLRLPNIPFFFSNGELLYTKLIRTTQRLSAWYNASYAHWFYLYWAGDGRPDTKATIPTQYIQNAGVSYAIKNNRYALSAEICNLADVRVYDNYGVQRPGRSFHLKLRTAIL